MPTLEWIGKDKVVNHHLEVPGGAVYIQRRGEREHDYPRGQSGGAQGPAAPV